MNTLTAILSDLSDAPFDQTATRAALTFNNYMRVEVRRDPTTEEWFSCVFMGADKLAGARHVNRELAAIWAARAAVFFRREIIGPLTNWKRYERNGDWSESVLSVGPISALVRRCIEHDGNINAFIYVLDELVREDVFRHPSHAESWAETMIAHIRGDRLPLTKEQVFAWVDDAVYACGQSVSNPRSRESIAKIIVDAWNGEMPDGLTLEPGESWRWINDTSVMKIIEDDNLRRLKLERK